MRIVVAVLAGLALLLFAVAAAQECHPTGFMIARVVQGGVMCQ